MTLFVSLQAKPRAKDGRDNSVKYHVQARVSYSVAMFDKYDGSQNRQ